MKSLVEQVTVSEDALAFLRAQHPDSMDHEEFLYFLKKPWKWQEEFTAWISERESARTEFRCNPDESGGVGEHLAESRAMEQWKEEKDGYDLTDPKHPDFHSVHADIWDAREGK